MNQPNHIRPEQPAEWRRQPIAVAVRARSVADRPAERRLLLAGILAVGLLLLALRTAAANGVPVQIFLDFAPFKATWEPASRARGVAVVASNDEQVRVMAQNLPAPPAQTVYYAWLEQVDGGYLPVGPLMYQADGTASVTEEMLDLPYSENFAWVLVSIEQPDAVGAMPAAEIALAGRLPNPVALPRAANELPELLPVTGSTDSGIDSGIDSGSVGSRNVLAGGGHGRLLFLALSGLIAASALLWTWQMRRPFERNVSVRSRIRKGGKFE